MTGHRLHAELIDPREELAGPARKLIEEFLLSLRKTGIGWHYATDLMWLCRRVSEWPAAPLRVLDAGGGGGPLQFLLAEMGFDVVNIDLSLPAPSPFVTRRYGTTRRALPSLVQTGYDRAASFSSGGWRAWLARSPLVVRLLDRRMRRWRRRWIADRPMGRIEWIEGNVARMPEIASASFDAVVSLSSLEHVPRTDLPSVVAELRRVVKPDGFCAITTSATDAAETWFHAPSRGLCFTMNDLGALFGADDVSRIDPGEALRAYRESTYLQSRLASFYRRSGNNGMPWGKWDPQYIPAGIFGRF